MEPGPSAGTPPREPLEVRAVVTRVRSASVAIDGAVTAGSAPGCSCCSASREKTRRPTPETLAKKIVDLRIFRDDAGAMNRSLADRGRSLDRLAVHAARRRPKRSPARRSSPRPSLSAGERSTSTSSAAVRGLGPRVATGEFGATMDVASVNDGPVTILIDTTKLF
jgi:D-tyrosyl-tRNA(Tyr) deacylase